MHEIQLSQGLFSVPRETILLTGAAAKTVGSQAPAGFGYSKSHKGTRPAKYNAVAKCLDLLLVNKVVQCLEGENNVYVEATINGKKYVAISDGTEESYVEDRMHGSAKFLPLMLFHLRSASKNTELKECFSEIKKSFDATGVAELEHIIRFCDCFYYSIAVEMTDQYRFLDNTLQPATVTAAIRSGDLKPFSAPLDGLEPSIWNPSMSATGASASSSASASSPFEAIKNGDKIIPFNWSERQKVNIPTLESLNEFVPNEEFYSILNKVSVRLNKVNTRLDAGLTGVEAIGKDYINLMLVGKPGTGKTTLLYALGAATGMPTYSVALNKDSESDVFQGMTKVVDGQLQFVSTDFLDAYTNGGIIIIEEINLANPNVVMGTIGQSIEYPFILMENGYKPIRRHPMCVIVATMNVGTYGSAGLNEALSSRFKSDYILNDPTDNDFINILQKAGGSKKASAWVLGIYKKILEFLMKPSVNAEDVCMRITMRGCIGALESIEEGENPKTAIKRTLIGKIAESDLQLAEDVWEAIKSLPDLK